MEFDSFEFSRNSTTFQEFQMQPPPEPAFFAAAAPHQYHQSDAAAMNSAFWTEGVNHSAGNLGGNFLAAAAAGNQLNSENSLALMMNSVHLSPRYTDDLLESELARLSLMPQTVHAPPYAPPSYGNRSSAARNSSSFANPAPQLRDMDIQRMRIQSAARGQAAAMYLQSQINLDEFAGNLNGFSPNFLNSNSSGRSLNQNQNQPFRSNGSFDLGSSRNNLAEWRKQQGGFRPPQRSNLMNLNSVKDLKGKIFAVATDQHGCRFLQSKFEEGKPEEIEMIFMEVKDHICELMVDQFGNYLVHKFLAACNHEQITHLLLTLISDHRRFMDICIDAHGSRSVQKVMEYLSTPEQRCRIIQVLKHITLPLAKSMNGHHVLQHVLKLYSVHEKTQILNVVADNCMEIATDKSGCCVLQSCVEHAVGEPLDRLITEITSNALMLSEHPYGNYVVQYIIGMRNPHATAAVVSQLTGNFVSLSMSKYGSNVVERFLKDPEMAQESIIKELVYSPHFLRVLQDPFGNYVAQSAYLASKGAVRSAMMSFIQANNLNLHSHPHGKRVLQCIKGNKANRV